MVNDTSTLAKTGNPLADFQEQVISKLKGDIGALMPDEVLASLVEKAVHKSFFEEGEVRSGFSSEKKPSWFMQQVAMHAKPIMEAQAKKYVEENKTKITEQIDAFLKDNNLMIVAMAALHSNTQIQMYDAVHQIMGQISQNQQFRG